MEARSVSIPGRLVSSRDDCVLHADYHRSWNFWDSEKERSIEIGDRTKALIVLLHDLLALEKEGGIVGSHALSPDSMSLGWAFASWDIGLRDEVKVPWITPAWTSFWEFDQFSHIWAVALKKGFLKNTTDLCDPPKTDSGGRGHEFLLYTWIAGIARIFESAPPAVPLESVILPKSGNSDGWSLPWDKLTEAVHKLLEDYLTVRTTVRAERIKSWLIRLPVLLAPESSLIGTKITILWWGSYPGSLTRIAGEIS